MPPAFQRGEHHEQIGGSIPLILVVVPRRVPWLRRNWHTRFRNELLRRLVQADQWTFWIVRSLVNSSTSSMPATNAALASGGMTHRFCRCGRRRFFLGASGEAGAVQPVEVRPR